MGNQSGDTKRVKPIYAYLKESIKFYDVPVPIVARIIFIAELFLIFGRYIFARPYLEEFFKSFEQVNVQLQNQLEAKNIDLSLINTDIYANMLNSLVSILLILLIINSVSFIVSLYFGTNYFFGLVHPSMKTAEILQVFFKRLPKIILFNAFFYCLFFIVIMSIFTVIGFAVILVPVFVVLLSILPVLILVVNTIYIFKDLLIIEFNVGVFRNFKMSLNLTRGCRKNVIFNGLWPICISWLLNTFTADIENLMLSLFITSFFEVIIILASQRLIALMFIDAAGLERLDKKQESPVNK